MRMLIAVSILLLVACAGNARQAEELPNLQTVEVPDFESDRGIGWASSREAYEAGTRGRSFPLSAIHLHVSDGLTVGAYLYRRTVSRAVSECPSSYSIAAATVRPNGFAGEMLVMAHRFAQAGFIVVAPQYRGSNGWAGRDRARRCGPARPPESASRNCAHPGRRSLDGSSWQENRAGAPWFIWHCATDFRRGQRQCGGAVHRSSSPC